MMSFAFGVIPGFSKFWQFLFSTDRKILIDCKIISFAISSTLFGGWGKVKVQIEAIKRKSIDKNVCIF